MEAIQGTWVRSLDREDPPEEEMTTHSSILAQKIPWREEPGGLPMGPAVRGATKNLTRLSH